VQDLLVLFRGDTSQFEQAAAKAKKTATGLRKDLDLGNVFDSFTKKGGTALLSLATKIAAPVAGFLALKKVQSEVSKQLETISELYKLSNKVGLPVDQLQVYTGLFKKAGLEQENVVSSVIKLQGKISDAAQGASGLQSTFRELGLDARQLNQMTPDQKFRAVADAISKISNQGDRVRLLIDLFGKEGGQLEAVFRNGSKGIDEVRAKLDKFGLLITPEQAASVFNAKKAMNDYGKVWSGWWQQITIRFAPDIQAAFELMTQAGLDSKDKLGSWASFLDPTDGVLGGFIDLAQDIKTLFLDIQSELTGMIGDATQLVGWIVQIGTAAWDLAHLRMPEWNVVLQAGWDLEKLAIDQDKAARENDKAPWSQQIRDQRNKSKGKTGTDTAMQQMAEFSKTGDDLVQKLTEQAGAFGLSSRQAEIYAAEVKGANRESVNAARDLDVLLKAKEIGKQVWDADPLNKYKERIADLQHALNKGTITQSQYNYEMRGAGLEVAGISSPIRSYWENIDKAQAALKAGAITQDEYNEKVRQLKGDLSGAKDPLADYNEKMRQLAKIRKEIGETAYNQAADNAKRDILGIPETATSKLKNYWTELARLNKELKDGIITGEEWRAKQNQLQEGLGFAQSPAQQMQAYNDRKKSLDEWAAKNGIDMASSQYKDSLKSIMPDFGRQLEDSTRTPFEKFQAEMQRLQEWKPYMTEDLYNRGVLQAKTNLLGSNSQYAGAMQYNSREAYQTLLNWRSMGENNNPQVKLVNIQTQALTEQQKAVKALEKMADSEAGVVVMDF